MSSSKGTGRRFFRFLRRGFLFMLAVELGVFFYLDQFYLKDTGKYRAEKVTSQSAVKLKQVTVDTGSGVSSYQCAYDGAYISYLKDGALVVVSLTNGKKSTITAGSGMSILAYRWIYDRNRILIVEKSSSGSYAKLYFYNTADKVKTEIDNAEKRQVLTIPLRSGTTSADLDMSTLTNLTYLKFTNKYGSRIYKIDVNVKRQLVSTVTSSIGKIAVLKNSAVFLYENAELGTVYRAGRSLALRVEGHRYLQLLGSDVNDTVYLAVPESGRTRTLFYGSVTASSWHTLRLESSVPISDIYFNTDTGPYAADPEAGTLTRLLTGARSTYKGTLLGIYNAGFFNLYKGKAHVNTLPASSK